MFCLNPHDKPVASTCRLVVHCRPHREGCAAVNSHRRNGPVRDATTLFIGTQFLSPPTLGDMNSDYPLPTADWSIRKAALPQPLVAIMSVKLHTGKKQQMDSHYVNAPLPYVVEENFEGYLPDHNDPTLAQILQDQETINQSFHRDAQFDSVKSSSTTTMGDHGGRLQRRENSTQNLNVDSQLAIDEAYARELQDLENQLSYTSLKRAFGTGTDVDRAESSTSSSKDTFANSATTRVDLQEDVDPDNMTYEELQSLGEAIGMENRGLSDELISYLPTSTYKIGIFSRREKNEECVICYMPYKNRDKLIKLPCKHQYHKGCVSHWLKINKACPVCNVEVFGS